MPGGLQARCGGGHITPIHIPVMQAQGPTPVPGEKETRFGAQLAVYANWLCPPVAHNITWKFN